jgi:membrane protein
MTNPPSAAIKSFWQLGGLTPWQLARTVFEQIVTNDAFGRAAELAFYFLFALFPLIFLMMTLFGLFASHSVDFQNNLLSYFADFLPPTAFELLRRVSTETAAHASNGKLTFGVVSALWCVSGSISSMISFLNVAHHVRETRPWFKARAIALGLSLLISILLLTALSMALVGNHFVGWLWEGRRLHPMVALVWKIIRWPTAIFLVALSCSLIYHYGPDLKDHRRWHWFTPGAAFGACIWLLCRPYLIACILRNSTIWDWFVAAGSFCKEVSAKANSRRSWSRWCGGWAHGCLSWYGNPGVRSQTLRRPREGWRHTALGAL